MKLLVLGGTGFLGRHLVGAAHARGHAVTLFNRGTRPDVFPEGVERLRGDRASGDLAALDRGRWDAAVDTGGYLPARARAAAGRLRARVGHYTFVSTLSVYDDGVPVPVTEDAAARAATPAEEARAASVMADGPTPGGAYGELYGPLKAGCEAAVREALAGPHAGGGAPVAVVRPGLIVGPHDTTDRFTYWPARVARGGDVLAPGAPDRPLQLVDARDLAAWMVRVAEDGGAGTFNATGPEAPLTMAAVLDACLAATGAPPDTRLVWIDDATLLAAGVAPWTELPLWVPAAYAGAPQLNADCRRARAAGLSFRPLVETVRDTLAWDRTRPPEAPRRAGLAPARERAILATAAAQAR